MAQSSSSANSPFVVSSPFLPSDGDVILRSVDGDDFYVAKIILTVASPFFRSMFSLPQPEQQDGAPVVPVPEESNTLDVLLRYVYPIREPVVDDLGLAENVLEAALKYEMESAVQQICRVLVSEKTLTTQALRIFAITCRFKLAEEARMAAIATLRTRIEDVYIKEFDILPSAQYFNLLKYHRRVKAEVFFVLRKATGASHEFYEYGAESIRADPTREVQSIQCMCTHEYSPCHRGVADWWKVFIAEQIIPAVYSAPLHPDLLPTDAYRKAEGRAQSCSKCTDNISGQWHYAVASLRELFDKKAREVRLTLLPVFNKILTFF